MTEVFFKLFFSLFTVFTLFFLMSLVDPASLTSSEKSCLAQSQRITVIGDGAVGKTSFLISYTSHSFPTDYVPTVFDNFNSQEKFGDVMVTLNLWDTAGQEEYDKLRPLSYPGTSVFIICFSADNPVSLENVADKWVPELKSYVTDPTIVLVCTKTDIRDNPEVIAKLHERGDNPVPTRLVCFFPFTFLNLFSSFFLGNGNERQNWSYSIL